MTNPVKFLDASAKLSFFFCKDVLDNSTQSESGFRIAAGDHYGHARAAAHSSVARCVLA